MGYKIIGEDLNEVDVEFCEEVFIPRTGGGYTQGFIVVDYTGLKSPWKHCVTMFFDKGRWAMKTVDKNLCKSLEEMKAQSLAKDYKEDSELISKVVQRQGYAWVLRELVNFWRSDRKDYELGYEISQLARKVSTKEK